MSTVQKKAEATQLLPPNQTELNSVLPRGSRFVPGDRSGRLRWDLIRQDPEQMNSLLSRVTTYLRILFGAGCLKTQQ